LKKYIFTIIRILIIFFVVTIIYWITQECIVFNDVFLKSKLLKPLYYLFPIIIGLLISLLVAFKFNYIPQLIREICIILVNTYLFLSVFLGTSEYCESEKNMELIYLIFLWGFFSVTIYVMIKYILTKLKTKDIITLGITTVLIFIDFYFSLISLNLLYYLGWFKEVSIS